VTRLHIADTFVGHLVAGSLDGLLHHARRADDITTSAAVQRWDEWTPTHQWMAEHGRKENDR
jgi:hypothetical protein